MKIRNLFLIALLSHLCLMSVAQREQIVPYQQTNIHLKNAQTQQSLKSLPFFDDFAYPYSQPLSSLWQDSDAYVNSAFAKNVITIGVATLDAMSNSGKLHENVSTTATISDYLTSLPINLKDYQHIYSSDKIYRKNASNFELLDESYYLFNTETNSYISVTQGIAYSAGDTLYKLSGESYIPTKEYLYDQNKQYIDGSYEQIQKLYSYSLADSLAFSFYYQSGGFLDTPERTDSLVLEFYIPYDTTGIFINEISKNGIELYNATDSLISLNGFYLVFDTLQNLITTDSLQYFTLSDIQIPPYQQYALSPMQFSKDSFSIAYAYLYSPDLQLIDSVDLQQKLTTDVVYARLTDGNPTWSFSATETLGECNPSWTWIWSTSKLTGDEFKSVYIPIVNSNYLVKGFRFRFKNYTSLSNDVSHARNEDCWHLDMIWLNSNRESKNQNVPDVAFANEISPLYTKYKALPMSHFGNVSYNDFRMTIPATFTNFDTDYRKIKFHFSVEKQHSNERIDFSTYETDIPAFTTASERDVLSDFEVDFFDFIAEDTTKYDNGEYEFQYYFTDINNPLYSQYRWNDTCRTTLKLANYYAYDDGTPEAGYGLREAPMGRVAFKYDILQSDTLKSVGIYFNPTMMETATTFNLCVWENDNGTPGNLIYYSPSEKTQIADEIYQFVNYDIKSENIVSGEENLLVNKSFFIGWEQPNDVLLNVGLDMNTSLNGRLYYNTGFEWEKSVQTGALMMRPYFGKYEPQTATPTIAKNSVKLYPTIAQDVIFITSNDEIQSITICNAIGTKILETTNTEIPLQAFSNGLYVAKILLQNGSVQQNKFVVIK